MFPHEAKETNMIEAIKKSLRPVFTQILYVVYTVLCRSAEDAEKKHTQGLLGRSGCGPPGPGGAPLGGKGSGLLMSE